MHAGMDVLDFGCGVGWLGRIFRQMGCSVTFLDVSATAIREAERFASASPPIGSSPFPRSCRFLVFDGLKIDLPDASMDRIISFDAFHHIANPDQVLAEFYRVLRPGGLVAFCEPGFGHSQSGAAQREMRDFETLENDIDLKGLCRTARTIGFTESRHHITRDPSLVLTPEEFFAFHDGQGLPQRVLESLRQKTRAFYVFFFHKGETVLDSRQHLGLLADMELVSEIPGEVTSPVQLIDLRVTNIGPAVWLAHTTSGIGAVKVGIHLASADGGWSDNDFTRGLLPHDVSPGETVRVSVPIRLPSPNRWRVTIDMVSEGVCWFENRGSKPRVLRFTLLE